ncbi:MAG: DUF6474 family protein [Gordonia sp. (in: high G+C Gram-positive bacteria)]
MGLFSSDGKSRAQRRAEAKALTAKTKLEAKLASKDRRAAAKQLRKSEHKYRKKQLKAQRKTTTAEAKAQRKVAKEQTKVVAAQAKAAADAKPFSPASVRRYLALGRIVAPIVVPIAYRAAVAGRGRITEFQASRAGVAPELLSQFSGHGAPILARIASIRNSLQKVKAQDTSHDSGAFVDAMTTRLDNLAVAVEASESMPTSQRRTAQRAVEEELAAIDADVLARLGVRT